jgi:hypothetical protein
MRPNPHIRRIGPPPEPVHKSAPRISGNVAHNSNGVMGGVPAAVIDEDTLRRQLGVAKSEPKFKLPDSYRTLLNLDPQDLVDFFDVVIDHRDVFEQVDFIVPAAMLEQRIRRLQALIKASKAVIEGMASHIIKIRRGKDDPLLDDKAQREKYKREENHRIVQSNVKLSQYRAALRSGKELHEKIWRTVSKPLRFRDLVDDHQTFRTVTDTGWFETDKLFTGGLQTHTRVELFEYLRHGSVDLESYRAVMSLGESALAELGETEAQQRETWDNIRQWENLVIVAAVRHRVIIPRRELAELMGLGGVLDESDLAYIGSDAENKLAVKTGGACFGGGIKGEGYRYHKRRVRQRGLSSFDKPLKPMENGDGYHDSGFQSLDNLSDDAESYDPPDDSIL